MSRWAVLPAELDPRVRQLVVRLRRLKDHSGLSLRQLAARTGYSPKSWERYLGGRSLPPAEAVEALARAVGEDPTRLLACHEVAAEAWGNRRAEAAATGPESLSSEAVEGTEATEVTDATAVTGARPPGRSLRVTLMAGTLALVLAVATAVLLVVRLGGGEEERPTAPLAATATSASAPAPQSTPMYTCRIERTDGRWYAGISRTRGAILATGHAGPEVAEAQCLLRRAGLSPGGIDGIFGPVTEHAVKLAQKRAGLVVDGIIGPHTWKALRR
ncbi:peptidoglycan-binding protein [Streptomyces viridochromogenes]|uniref:peptidoglycan-binding protein n=1 Tax=Streptomyces viridochromogenes TaxID=1938 RepID=UPI00069D65F4|nr:peptidoglycan-binding protein [Streptomyces viridochromogenes]KOG09164.1 peptidoglycan-binding protein [Streptomyces viridochromogenes]KOG25215.1 peptidoglycan-binding protein [Streptomyces viridochromogenes]